MARVVAKYDLVTVPVVDDQNRLVGTITVDDVIDVVQEEASEDIFRMAGSDAAELERRSPGQVAHAAPALGPPDAPDRDARRAWSSTTSTRRSARSSCWLRSCR